MTTSGPFLQALARKSTVSRHAGCAQVCVQGSLDSRMGQASGQFEDKSQGKHRIPLVDSEDAPPLWRHSWARVSLVQ